VREIKELGFAIAETEGWIDDLTLRLNWRDRDKTYAVLVGALHGLRMLSLVRATALGRRLREH